jgi:hypothetical protein
VQIRSVWLAIVFCLGLAIPAYATTIFTEDYEVADMTALTAKGWTYTFNAGAPTTMDIVGTPVNGGSKALRMTYEGLHCPSGCDDSSNSKITRTFSGLDEIYERYWVRYERIVEGTTAAFATALNAGAKQHYFNPGGADPVSVIFGYYFTNGTVDSPAIDIQRPFTVTCPDGKVGTTCIYPPNRANVTVPIHTSASDNPGVWTCIENHQKMNTPGTANGVIEVWINGTLTTQYTNVIYRDATTATSQFRTLQVYRQGADNMYRYEDDLVVSTTRVGCSGNPSADATPPKSPTGLALR